MTARAVADPLLSRVVRDPRLRRLASFTLGSGFGLVVDVGGFFLLTTSGLEPGLANVVSSVTSIVVVYLFVTRRTFAARLHAATFGVFLAWYGLNVAVTSTVIQLGHTDVGGPALAWKLTLVPFSFAANYGFNLALHRFRLHRTATR